MHDFHNFKIMEFMRLIHVKSIGPWWESNIHDTLDFNCNAI